MPEPHLRAADADRAAVAARLGEHMTAGRLTVAEYEERLAGAYAATTYGELAQLTEDLPGGRARAVATDHRERATRRAGSVPWPCGAGARGSSSARAMAAQRWAWHSWASTAVVVLTVWALTSMASGTLLYFWPVWVIGPWGAVLLSQRVIDRRGDVRRGRTSGRGTRLRRTSPAEPPRERRRAPRSGSPSLPGGQGGS